jgi:peptide/nickel transport system substrate-binding protein
MKSSSVLALMAMISLSVSACSPSGPATSPQDAARSGSSTGQPDRTLILVTRAEPRSLALRPVGTGASFQGFALSKRLLNADLVLLDDAGSPHLYLAETSPQLNTDTWRVFPDGRMETTWKLKPNIVWHDGTALSAQDFAFSWQVYLAPDFALMTAPPFAAIEEVVATDSRTLMVRWRRPYPDAGQMTGNRDLPALPRHLLEASFQSGDLNAFANNAYWTREYVGLGPYRLEQWEPGSFLVGVAFDRHVWGAPKMSRVKLAFIPDMNAAQANILAGDVHFVDSAITIDQALTLKADWEKRGAGVVAFLPDLWRTTGVQLRPEYVAPSALLDARVRKALAHTIDKQAVNDGVYRGVNTPSEFFVPADGPWGPALAGAVQKYPYDLRRSEQLMGEAGFTKGPDGMYLRPGEGRFKVELKSGVERADEMTAMASGWRDAGFDVQDAVLPAALATDPAARITFPGLFSYSTPYGDLTLFVYTTDQIPRSENNWRGGNNRVGWSNAEYDRLSDAFERTLEPSQRATQMAQMAKLFTEDLAYIPLFFLNQASVWVSGLQGVASAPKSSDLLWNIHEWELR